MNFEKVKLNDLKPASYNPRQALTPDDDEYKKIAESIKNFGYVDPIIANKDMTVIGGHQRLTVLKDLGYDEETIVIVDIDKDKEKALNIALNKITGAWDSDKLTELLANLNNINMAHMTGFSKQEIEDLLKDVDIDAFFTSEENAKKQNDSNEKECPECGALINTKDWTVVE
jgi:site-specific DNA-methyltransferase (adenine-specific)